MCLERSRSPRRRDRWHGAMISFQHRRSGLWSFNNGSCRYQSTSYRPVGTCCFRPNCLIVWVIGHPPGCGEVIDSEVFFELSELGPHLLKVGIGLALGMCQRLLYHQEFIEFMWYVKVRLFHVWNKRWLTFFCFQGIPINAWEPWVVTNIFKPEPIRSTAQASVGISVNELRNIGRKTGFTAACVRVIRELQRVLQDGLSHLLRIAAIERSLVE